MPPRWRRLAFWTWTRPSPRSQARSSPAHPERSRGTPEWTGSLGFRYRPSPFNPANLWAIQAWGSLDEVLAMKQDIHPVYPPSRIVCACGNIIETRSTRGSFHVEICSNCHPFFTGKYKLVDTQGRVERFRKKFEGKGANTTAASIAAEKAPAKGEKPAPKAKA